MIKFDDSNIRILNARLTRMRKDGIPLAVAETLNNMAFTARKISIVQFEANHIIRSNWTQRGMRYQSTKRTVPIRQMESREGSVLDYTPLLEHGGTARPNSGSLLQIPALGARVSKSKHKRIARKFTLQQTQNLRRLPTISGSAKRKFAAMLNMGRKEKYFGPFVVTKSEAGGENLPIGVFMLSGRGRLNRGGGQITMLRKFQNTAKVSGHSFIAVAGLRVGQNMDRIYVRNAKRTLAKYAKDIR